jgi:pantoate--beta-alanine ligase
VRTLRTVAEVRAALQNGHEDRSVGLVPTMGALHEGHLALIRAARADCDDVVVSLFVNPAQFNEAADLAAYPRDEARDAALAAESGADLLFAPAADEIYPPGFATTVRVGAVSEPFEGAHRPGHFDGVATVVTKLFTIVRPDVAYFGRKDAQQLAVIRRLVRDLELGVRIEAVDTVREPDGLALSSRNVRLAPDERRRALALKRGLDTAVAAPTNGGDLASARAAGEQAMREAGVEPEYLAIVNPDTFVPVEELDGDVLVAVAARVGDTRLIDNVVIPGRQ